MKMPFSSCSTVLVSYIDKDSIYRANKLFLVLSEKEDIRIVQDFKLFCRMRLHLNSLLHISTVGMEAGDLVYSQLQHYSWWLSTAACPESHQYISFFFLST